MGYNGKVIIPTNLTPSYPGANDLLPEKNTHAYWFKLADSIRKEHDKEDVLLFQNQYQIISGTTNNALTRTVEGYESVGRVALYAEMIDKQIAAGAKIYKRLCYFDRFNLPYHATEFELRDGKKVKFTEEQRRKLSEYMMAHLKLTVKYGSI